MIDAATAIYKLYDAASNFEHKFFDATHTVDPPYRQRNHRALYRLYTSSVLASPTACPSRGYGCAGTSERGAFFSTQTPVYAHTLHAVYEPHGAASDFDRSALVDRPHRKENGRMSIQVCAHIHRCTRLLMPDTCPQGCRHRHLN